MSGGVDSSLSLHLLQEKGYDVTGVYMRLHGFDKTGEANAEKVAKAFGVKLYTVDFRDAFDKEVYSYFVQSYKQGVTPNPCVVCNRGIKFGKLVDFAQSLGIKKVATGHYVQSDGTYFYEGADKSKDQSYFLAKVAKDIPQKVLFPLGSWKKEDVKARAADFDVLQTIAAQKESSEICFVEDSYLDVLKAHMDVDRTGTVVDKEGNEVGTHKGYMHYTVGKRRGFDVPKAQVPHYVTSIDAKNNIIRVGLKEDLRVDKVVANDLNFFGPRPRECTVKVRYRTQKLPASIEYEDNKAIIYLDRPAYGVAKGQIAAFYEDEKLLGGGTIIA